MAVGLAAFPSCNTKRTDSSTGGTLTAKGTSNRPCFMVQCDVCDKEIKLNYYDFHMKTHTGLNDGMICTTCEMKFTSRLEFVQHMEQFHIVKRTCVICSDTFLSTKCLYEHVKQHGTIRKLRKGYPDHVDFFDSLLKRFKRRMHGRRLKCKICGKQFLESYLRRYHSRIHTHQNTPCDVCGKEFPSWQGLKNHMKTHSLQNNARYQCHMCSRMFHRSMSLQLHLLKHAGVATNTCKECLRPYTGSYENHVQEVHKKDGFSFTNCRICKWCGKRFLSKYKHDRHVLSHTGEKAECKICGKKVSRFYLNQHNIQQHGDAARNVKEMTECKVCEKRMKKTYLSVHMKFHQKKKFQCEECGKCFPLRHNLDTHRKSHTEYRPYSCDLCEKTFKLPHHMRAHKRRHKNHVVKNI